MKFIVNIYVDIGESYINVEDRYMLNCFLEYIILSYGYLNIMVLKE